MRAFQGKMQSWKNMLDQTYSDLLISKYSSKNGQKLKNSGRLPTSLAVQGCIFRRASIAG